MQTTLKRIDVGSAFRVGFILFGLIAVVFGLLFVGLQGLLLTTVSNLARDTVDSSADISFLMTGGIASLCIFYGILVVFSAIGGGIQLALMAFFYNLTVNWVGGIKIEFESPADDFLDDVERDLGKPKRGDV